MLWSVVPKRKSVFRIDFHISLNKKLMGFSSPVVQDCCLQKFTIKFWSCQSYVSFLKHDFIFSLTGIATKSPQVSKTHLSDGTSLFSLSIKYKSNSCRNCTGSNMSIGQYFELFTLAACQTDDVSPPIDIFFKLKKHINSKSVFPVTLSLLICYLHVSSVDINLRVHFPGSFDMSLFQWDIL